MLILKPMVKRRQKLLITLDYWDGSFMPSSWIDEVVSNPVETVATTENPGVEETNP